MMRGALACLMIGLWGATPAGARDPMPLEEGTAQVRELIRTCDGLVASCQERFGPTAAEATLRAVLPAEVGEKYARDWGTNGLWLRWQALKESFVEPHCGRLRRSLTALTRQGFADPEDIAYLEQGMQALEREHAAMREGLEGQVRRTQERGQLQAQVMALHARYRDAGSEERERIQAETRRVSAERQRVVDTLRSEADALHRHYAGLELFSALEAEERIALAEEEETCEEPPPYQATDYRAYVEEQVRAFHEAKRLELAAAAETCAE